MPHGDTSDSLNEMAIHSTFRVIFAAIVVIRIFISLQGNVTTTELWAISKLGVDDVDVVKGNHTAGIVTLEKMKYNTTFTALSKTLKN